MKDEHFERLAGHLSDRDWSDVQIINFAQKIAQSHLLSHESVLVILEYQQEVDEHIQAEKEHDRWAIGREMAPILERTETAQSHFEQRFEETL